MNIEEFGRSLNYTSPSDEEITTAYLQAVDNLITEIKQKRSIDSEITNRMDDAADILRETDTSKHFVKEGYFWMCLLDRFMIVIKRKDRKVWYFYGDNYEKID